MFQSFLFVLINEENWSNQEKFRRVFIENFHGKLVSIVAKFIVTRFGIPPYMLRSQSMSSFLKWPRFRIFFVYSFLRKNSDLQNFLFLIRKINMRPFLIIFSGFDSVVLLSIWSNTQKHILKHDDNRITHSLIYARLDQDEELEPSVGWFFEP